MPTNIVVPQLGESVVEATITRWHKREGDRVAVGDILLELETEKVNLEVGSEHAGVLTHILKHEGEDVRIGDVIAVIDESPAAVAEAERPIAVPYGGAAPGEPAPGSGLNTPSGPSGPIETLEPVTLEKPVVTQFTPAAPGAGMNVAQNPNPTIDSTVMQPGAEGVAEPPESSPLAGPEARVSPAAEPRPGAALPSAAQAPAQEAAGLRREAPRPAPSAPPSGKHTEPGGTAATGEPAGLVERVKMSRRRRTIARNLVEAQHSAAMLTTFNEIDMSRVMELRKRFKERFEKQHGIGLGLTSFFVKAAVAALKAFPVMNAELQGEDVLYKKYFDIGVAMDTPDGLIVPVLRGADAMSFAAIERAIRDFRHKAEHGTLSLDDLRGGCFTITNGGIFGSLLSTPILNTPQVGILGLHRIEERPIAVAGQVVIHPMMYVALSYDHRLIDGRVAVQFLVRIKELIEEPATLLLEA